MGTVWATNDMTQFVPTQEGAKQQRGPRRKPVKIRYATPEELEAALAVHDVAFAEHRDIYRARAEEADRQAARLMEGRRIVALEQGQIVGTAQYADHGDHFHILGLAVHPAGRRCGITRQMIDWIEQRAAEARRLTIALDTIAETGNVGVFERLGFSGKGTELAPWCEFDLHETERRRGVRMACRTRGAFMAARHRV